MRDINCPIGYLKMVTSGPLTPPPQFGQSARFFKSNISTSVSSSSSQVENANTLTMKCSDVYLYESSLQPDQFGSLPKLQVSPKSLFLPLMMMATMKTKMMLAMKMTKMMMAMKMAKMMMATKMAMTTIIMARRWR